MSAIDIIKKSMATHTDWAEFFEAYPEAEELPDYKKLGGAKFHRETEKEYQQAIEELADLKAEVTRLEAREYQECKVFVDHIKAHLLPSQFVKCKICNKTINDIWHEALKDTTNTHINCKSMKK